MRGSESGFGCVGSEIQRIAQNAPHWPDMKTSRRVIANRRPSAVADAALQAKVAPSRASVLNKGTFLCGALANPEPPDSAWHGSRGNPGVRAFRHSKSYEQRETGAG